MQNKGIVKFIAVLLILVCCFYLSFSFVTRHYESKAAAMGEEPYLMWLTCSLTTRPTLPTRRQWSSPRRKRRPARTTSSLCS